MTPVFRICRVLFFAFGISVAASGAARSEGPPVMDHTRDSIIQSVRDDVRRKIGNQQTAQYGAESGTVGEASPRAYRQRKTKQLTN